MRLLLRQDATEEDTLCAMAGQAAEQESADCEHAGRWRGEVDGGCARVVYVEADHVKNDGYTLTLMEIGAELASRATQVSALWSPTVFAPLSRLIQRGRCSSAATRAPTVLLVMCMQRWVVQYM
jgi:hypothetical protein